MSNSTPALVSFDPSVAVTSSAASVANRASPSGRPRMASTPSTPIDSSSSCLPGAASEGRYHSRARGPYANGAPGGIDS